MMRSRAAGRSLGVFEEREELSPFQREGLVVVLQQWLDSHPEPDAPALAALGRGYTPRQIVAEVRAGTEFGNHLAAFLYRAAAQYRTTPADFINRAIEANRRGQ